MADKPNLRWPVIGAFALIYLVWVSTYLALALALGSIPPFLLTGSRSVLGGLTLVAGARLSGSPAASAADWARASLCGTLFFVGGHGVLAYAQQRVPSGIAALLFATVPFWIAMFDAVMPGGNRLSSKQILFLVPGFVGVALVVTSQEGSRSYGAGELVMLLAAGAAWALGTILSNRWSPPDHPIAYSGMQMIGGGVLLLLISAMVHEPGTFSLAAVSARAFGGWLYLTVMGTIVTFAAYIWLLKQVPSKFVATFAFVNPVVAAILGWLVLSEELNSLTLMGGALVVGSVVGILQTGASGGRASQRPDTPVSDHQGQ